jgi:ankyrin repeat protein
LSERGRKANDREKRVGTAGRWRANKPFASLYRRFRRAANRHDAEAVTALIREHPVLRDYEGDAGSLVDVLDREAPELLEAAFEAGLSPDAGMEAPCQTFLQHAVAEGEIEKVRLALRYGANPERRNNMDEVALGYACSWGQLEVAKLLVEAGADVNAIEETPDTGYRNTPLDCTRNYPEIAAYLRSKGAKRLHEIEGGPAAAADDRPE